MADSFGRSARGVAIALFLGTAPGALMAQAVQPPADNDGTPVPSGTVEPEEEEIVVTGGRLVGAAIGDIPPEITLNAADVRSYGVSNITELLTELSPQTGSAQGRGSGAPVVLLNGKRISGMGEIRDIPTEAIQRVEVLPEEVALKYGYRPDQKVVNFVLRNRFRAITGEIGGGIATEGGGESARAEADLLRIRDGGRLSVSLDYRDSARLKESERDIVSGSSGRPYDFTGNVSPAGTATQVDPALSALAGQIVTVAGVPAAAAAGRPPLSSFVPTANIANVSDISRYRTLRPASDELSANAVLARSLGDVSATVNASFGATGSDSLRGLPGATLLLPAGNPFSPFTNAVTVDRYIDGVAPLTQTTAGETAHAGFSFNGQLKGWNWSATGNYDYGNSRTVTERGIDISTLQTQVTAGSLNAFGTLPASQVTMLANDRAKAISNTGNVQLVANRGLFELPAGEVQTSLKVGGEILGFNTDSLRGGVMRETDLTRREGNAQVNLDIPLTSRREGFLDAIGTLSANFNYALNEVSDFGTLKTLGYGVTWKPIDQATFIASVSDEDNAPSVQQLGNPQVLTPDVRVFDYLRGTTVDISRIDGGNPDLLAENRRVIKLGLTVKPLEKADLTLTANYVDARTRNLIATLPSPTAQIEAAFPDRFVRDADGDLIRIDNRPVNYASEQRRQLRWGFNVSKPLKSKNAEALRAAFRELRNRDGTPLRAPGAPVPGAEAARGTQGQGARTPGGPPPEGQANRGGGQGQRGPGGPGGRFGGGGPGGGGGGRLQFAVYHTWLFQDDITIRPGVPVLDLLDGASSGSGGGVPRHQVEVQAGYANDGIGARLSVNWQNGTEVRGGTTAGNGDLFFSDFATANLRLFANLSQFPSLVKHSWARGTRVSLSVNNLLGDRQRVRNALGVTPLGYQPGYLDPLGREVRFSIRKLFF